MDFGFFNDSLAIISGAIPGALMRFYITEWSKKRWGVNFPYGTFIINISGCLLIGFFLTFCSTAANLPKELDLFARTGFLGSYTTFSTYEWETIFLWRQKEMATTVFYYLGSAIVSIGSVYLGDSFARFLMGV